MERDCKGPVDMLLVVAVGSRRRRVAPIEKMTDKRRNPGTGGRRSHPDRS